MKGGQGATNMWEVDQGASKIQRLKTIAKL